MDFSRLLSGFPVFFKADLIFKDDSRKPSKFKYFSSLREPWKSKADYYDMTEELMKTQTKI